MENNFEILTTKNLALTLLEKAVNKANVKFMTSGKYKCEDFSTIFKILLFENILDATSQKTLYTTLNEIFLTYKVTVSLNKINENHNEYIIDFQNVPQDIISSLVSLKARITSEIKFEAKRRNNIKNTLDNFK